MRAETKLRNLDLAKRIISNHKSANARKRWLALSAATGLVSLVASSHAMAGNQTWNGGSLTDGNWTDTANWVGGAAPGDTSGGTTNTDIAVFNSAIANTWGNAVGNPVVIDNASENIGGINFDTASDNYFIGGSGGAPGGNSLLLTSGGTIQILSTLTSTNAVETINAPLMIEGTAYTLANNSASGTGAGSGTLNINGTIGATGPAILTLTGSNTNANTISGIIGNGSGMGVTMSGTGSWTLSGANVYLGMTTVSSGTLIAANNSALGNATSATGGLLMNPSSGAATVDFTSSGVAIASLANSGAGTSNIVLGNTVGTPSATSLTVDGNNASTVFSGSISDLSTVNSTAKGSIVKAGSGTLTISGVNTYKGTTGISLGTLDIVTGGSINGGAFNTPSAVANWEIAVDGGTITSTGTSQITPTSPAGSGFMLNSGSATFGTLETSASADAALIQVIGGSLTATDIKMQRNNNTLTSASATTGLVVTGGSVNATTIELGTSNSSGTFNLSGTGSITTTGAVTVANQTSSARGGVIGVSAGTFTVGDTTNGLVLVKTVTATPVKQVANVFLSGGVTNLGKVSFGFDNTVVSGSTAEIVMTNAAQLYIGSGGMVNNAGANLTPTFSMAGTSLLGAAADWSTTLSLTLAGTPTFQASDPTNTTPHNMTLGGVLSGSAATPTKTGAGTLTLSGANTYGGLTTISAGVLSTGATGVLANGGSNSSVGKSTNAAANLVLDGGTLQYANTCAAESTDRLFTLTLNGGGLDASGTNPVTFAGNGVGAANAVAFTGSGTRTFTLTGTNTGANIFTPILADGGGATSLSKSGAGSWTVNGPNTFSGGVSVTGGNLTLAGSNVYTGNTTIGNGTLTVASGAAIANTAVIVGSGGTFASTLGSTPFTVGSTGASLTLGAGSTLTLEDGAVGTFNFNSTGAGLGNVLALNGTTASPSTLKFDVGTTGADQLIANNGTVSFGATPENNISLQTLGTTAPTLLTNIPLLTVPNGSLVLADFQVQAAPLLFGSSAFAPSLTLGAGNHSLLLTLTPVVLNYYWKGGAAGGASSWNAINNFATDQTGGTLRANVPGAGSNIFLTANSASNFAQTLDASFSVNSLSFTGTGTSAATNPISLASGGGGTNTLTITATGGFKDSANNNYGPGVGIVVQSGSNANTISANVVLGSTQTWEIDNAAANALTVGGTVTDGGSNFGLTKTGVGSLILSNTNSYGGLTTVASGVVTASADSALGSSTTATSGLLLNAAVGSANVNFTSANPAIGSLASNPAGANSVVLGNATVPSATNLTVGGSNASTAYFGSISDLSGTNPAAIGSLTKIGTGTLTLNGSGTYTGATAINGGALAIASDAAIHNGAGGISFGGGALQFNNYASSNLPVASFDNNPNVKLGAASGAGASFITVIGDSSALAYVGPGTLQLLGNNTYTGGTTIAGGVLNAGSTENPGTSGPLGASGNIAFTGGTLQYSLADQFDYSPRIANSTGPISIDTNTQNVVFQSALASTNSGGLTKLGAGSLTLAAANSYTGLTTVSAGSLTASTDTSLGSVAATSGLLLNPSSGVAAANFVSLTPQIGSLASSGAGTSSVVLGDAVNGAATTLTVGASGSSTTFAGTISDGSATLAAAIGSLAKTGTGTLALTNVNTYSGNTAVNAGAISIPSTGSIGSGATQGTVTIGVAGSAGGNTAGGLAATMTVNAGSVTTTTLSTNNEGGQNLSLTNNGSITVTGTFRVNNDNNNNPGYATLTSGTLTANAVTVGRTGLNSGNIAPTSGQTTLGLYINGATMNVATTLGVGTPTGATSSANMRMDSGNVTVGGSTTVTDNNNRYSMLDISGGHFTDNDTSGIGIQIGGNFAAASGELLIRNTAIVSTPAITFGNPTQTSGHAQLVIAGGTLYVGAGGIVNGGFSGVTPVVDLGFLTTDSTTAAVLAANADWSSSLNMTIANGTTASTQVPTFQTADALGAGHNITLTGSWSGSGSMNVTGAGVLTYGGNGNAFSSDVNVNGGTFALADTGTLATATLTTQPGTTANITGLLNNIPNVNDGGSVVIGATTANNDPAAGILARNWNSLTVNPGASVSFAPATTIATRTVLVTPGLTNSGKIDMSSNDMIIQGAGELGYGTFNSQVATGRGANGLWTGATGITSSAAAAVTAGSAKNTAVAIVVNDTNQSPTGSLSGTPIMGSFDGVGVSDGDVLVKYTYYGDANLDGVVNAADYIQIDNGFNADKTSPGTLTGWYNGDFNYDGVINGDDYTLIDNAYNTQGGVSLAVSSAGPAEMIAGNTDQVAGATSSAVPEPGALSLIGIAAFGLISRRKRRNK